MNSIIFDVLIRFLTPIIWVLSVWIFIRGHNDVGGGFVAGLMASSATILQILSRGWNSLRPFHRENILSFIGVGLFVAICSGFWAVSLGNPYLTGRWFEFYKIKIGTPLLFDLGIFITVYSTCVTCVGYLIVEDESSEEEPT
jgi:multisubunit Na+/H+ antiporter MnhB subunit